MKNLFKKTFASFLCVCFLSLNLTALGTEITVSNTYKTGTDVNRSIPNNYNIQTTSTNSAGTVGINAFDRFNVSHGDTVNFNLINSQNKLVNLIYDTSASQIDGIINSYKNGVIGGNMLFANSNGFIIGSEGKFNVGSLTLMTPTTDAMKSIMSPGMFSSNTFNENKLNSLISFSMNGNDYLVNGTLNNEIEINPSGTITINGTINSGAGIDLIAGNKIDINSTAQLNANQNFTISGDTITNYNKLSPNTTSLVDNKRSMAMDDGSNIVIVASNSGKNKDYMSAIVNLSGTVNANQNDVIAESEVYKTNDSGNDGAFVYAKTGSSVSGKDITLKAQSKITAFDDNLLNLKDSYGSNVPIIGNIADALSDAADYIAGYAVHKGNINSKVEVQSGAVLNASDNLNLKSSVDAVMSASTTSIGLAVGVVDLSSTSESIVDSGAILHAKNLNVSADNDLDVSVKTQINNMADNYIKNNIGNATISVAVEKLKTNAEVDKGADISKVTDNVTVNATTSNKYNETTKNSAVPLIDKDHGELGIGVAVNYIDSQNTATLNADTSVSGDVSVTADTSQQIYKSTNIYATGSSGFMETLGKKALGGVLKSDKLKPAMALASTKSNMDVTGTEITGAVGVSVVNASSVAKIGDAGNNIKPTVTAKNVNVSATMIDSKSNFDVEASSENEAQTASGAIGVNYKNLSSSATANAAITVNNSYNVNSYSAARDNTKDTTMTAGGAKLYAWDVTIDGNATTLYTTGETPDVSLAYQSDGKGGYVSSPYEILSYDSKTKAISIVTDYGKRSSSDDVAPLKYTDYYAWTVNYDGKTITLYTKSSKPSAGDVLYTNSSGTSTFVPSNKGYYVKSVVDNSGDKVITVNRSALNVTSETKITHPLSYFDFVPSLISSIPDFFSHSNWAEAWDKVKAKWGSGDSSDPRTYSEYLTALSGLSSVTDTQLVDDITQAISLISNTNNFGINNFFTTYVQASTNSASKASSSGVSSEKAFSGAIGVSAFTQNANAQILDGSSITMNTTKDGGKISVLANSKDEDWTAATLLNPLNFKNFAFGTSSGGVGVGGTIAVGYNDVSSNAKIGKNVNITTGTGFNGASDVNVISKTDGSSLNLSVGSSNADGTGVAGSIDIGYIEGSTTAGIESGANIHSNGDLNVEALKDVLNLNVFMALAKASTSSSSDSTAVGFGVSGLIIQDTVDAYINGDVSAKNANVIANYNETAANAGVNLAVQTSLKAKSQVDSKEVLDKFNKQAKASSDTDLGFVGALLSQDWDRTTIARVDEDQAKSMSSKSGASSSIGSASQATGKLSSSAAGAGGITVSWLDSNIKAHVGGTVNATDNVTVKATNNANLYDSYAALALGGKKGAGASVMLDVLQNKTYSYLDKDSTVNAGKDLSVDTESDYNLVAASAGISSGKDSTGAGNLAVTIELNDSEAYIGEGAKVNKDSENSAQTVSVKANNNTSTIKVAGAGAVQAGASSSSTQTAVGATVDAEVIENTVKAYIAGSTTDRTIVNAGKSVSVTATNVDKFIGIDVAGAIATGSSASGFAGVLSGGYISDNIGAYISYADVNKAQDSSKADSAQSLDVKATNDYLEVAIEGTGAGGTSKSVGATLRTDIVNNKVNSYVDNSVLEFLGATNFKNSENIYQIDIAATGSVATGSSGASVAGVVQGIFSFSDQENYISNSTLKTSQLTMDVDKDILNIGVTGAISVNTNGAAVGESLYVVGIGQKVKNYIENSDITSTNDVLMTTDFDQTYVGVTFGGGVATSSGVAVSGAYNVLVNKGTLDTHISSTSNDARKTVKSTAGKVTLKSNTDIDEISALGQVSVSTSSAGAGAAILTDVYDSTVKAYIENTNVYAQNGVDVEAIGNENHDDIVVGFAGGQSAAFEGSLSTLVFAQNVDAHIKNADIYTDKDITVNAQDSLLSIPLTGAVGVSTSGAGVGGAIFTGVIAGNVNALAQNVDVYNYTDNSTSAIGAFLVKAIQSDELYGATVAGAASTSSLAAAGSVTTVVIDKDVTAEANNVNNKVKPTETDASKFSSITVDAEGTTKFGQGTGSVSGASTGAVGGAASTLVINKDINAKITNSNMNTSGNLINKAVANTWIESILLAGSGAGTAAVNGAISTQVLNVDPTAQISGSTLTVDGATSNTAKSTVWDNMNIATVSGAGTTALGGAVFTLADDTDTTANIINSNIYKTTKLDNTSTVDSTYLAILFGVAGSGTVAASGAVSTIVLNSTSNANIAGSNIGDSTRVGAINDKATNTSVLNVAMAKTDASGTIAAGGTTSTVVSAKKAQASIDSSNVYSNDTINVDAENTDTDTAGTINIAASGGGAVGGSINTIVSSNTTNAFISNSTVDTTVANNVISTSGVNVTASDISTIGGVSGSVAGSQYVAVGAAIFTGVIANNINSYISNSDVNAANSNVTVASTANESLGATTDPVVVVAAAGAIAGVSGAIDTLVLSSSSNSYISGKKTNGITAGNNVNVLANGTTNSFIIAGALGVGGGGVGATVNTFVVGKSLISKIKSGAKVTSTSGKTTVKSTSTDSTHSYEVAGGAGGLGVGGVVSTNVIQNTLTAAIEDSSTTVDTKDLLVNAQATSNYSDTAGSLGVGGNGYGLSVQTNVIASNLNSYVKDATVTDSNSINISANSTQSLDYVIVSGAAGASGSAAGSISTNVINNNINAYASGAISGAGSVTIDAKDSTKFNKVIGGVVALDSTTGVGATIVTNVVSSSVNSYAGGTISSGNLTINASTVQNFDNLYVLGFAGGMFAVSGSVLVNVVDTAVNAYTENGSTIIANDININANANTNIAAIVGSAAVAGAVSVGASVEVNSIKNTVKAYTGDYNTITANSLGVNSTSTVNIGSSGTNQVVVAGGVGLASAAGAVVVNDVEDGVYAFIGGKGDGANNSTITTTGDINVKAAQNTNIYQSIGSATLASVGIGASIAVNTVKNTVNSYVDDNTNINTDGNILVDASSKEVIQGRALAASGGLVGLSGGLIYTTVGQTVASASSADNTTNSDINTAIGQGNSALTAAQNYKNQSQTTYTSNLNNTYSGKTYSIDSKKAEVQSTLQTALNNGLNAKVKKNSTSNLASDYTDGTYASTAATANAGNINVSNLTPTSYNKTATDTASRKGATSAFIGSGVTINKNSTGVKSLTVNSKNEDDIDLTVIGGAAGFIGAGIAATVANDYTTTEAYINSATNIYSGNIKINSTSVDNMNVHSIAATGGIFSGSGAVAIANSQKSTKSYINDSTTLSSDALIEILTDATSSTSARTDAYAIGGGVVGVSLAYAYSQGENTVNLGNGVTLDSVGKINIKTNSSMSANANSTALTGSLVGGTGAVATAKAGQNAKVTIGSDLSVNSTGALAALSQSTNTATADTNGRAYGGISEGVTKTTAEVSNSSGNAQTGVTIADSSKAIKAKGFGIGSNMSNAVKGSTKAGSGAIVSGSISDVNSNIKADNESSIGSATIDSTGGQYSVASSNANHFESSNNSSAYGAIAATVGEINNNINSTVKSTSNAYIAGSSSIAITANNTIEKSSTSSNDLVGGAGGIAGIGSAVITDTINATTQAILAGTKALSTGDAYTTAYTRAYDVEKVDVTGYGALAASDGDAIVNTTISNIAEISNSNIGIDGNAYYSATTDVDISTKSNVEAYGAMPVATGESSSILKSLTNKVIFDTGANTTSGLDTYISAVTYEDLTAKMYAYSKGLLWNVGSSSANAKNEQTNNVVSILNGANVNSYGTVNVDSLDYHDVSASRTAKTVGYAFFGIPITITSHSHANTKDNVYSAIELNGSITSGLGSQRQLTINKANNSDGYKVSDDSNIAITGKVTLGKISSSDVTSLETNLKTDYDNNTTAINSEKQTYDTQIAGYNKTISDNENALSTATTSANSNLTTAQTYVTNDLTTASTNYKSELSLDTNTINSNYKSYSSTLSSATATEPEKLTAIQNAHDSASSLANTLTTAANTATQKGQDAATQANNYKTQRDSYAVGSDNYKTYDALYTQYSASASGYTTESNTLSSLASNQTSLVSSYQTVIANYTNAQKAYANATSALSNATAAETNLNNQLATLKQNYDTQKAYYDSILALGTSSETYNLLNIDDVVVRSGETNIKGNITGSGSISAPGNKFIINVVNNTINDIQYNTLKIGTNLKGGIYIDGSVNGITQTIRSPGTPFYNIAVTNTVDINDPTVKFDAAGNMLFAGDITNPNGSLNILNWTGNVVTQGAITVKDLSIAVPNGDYMQGYTNSQFSTGGTSGGGDIIAGGDINIMAQTINVNGLIQSGSDIKKVTINDFDVKKSGDNYYQSVGNNNYVEMEQAVTNANYYYIKGTSSAGIQYNLVYKDGNYYQLKTDGSWYKMASAISDGKTYWSYGAAVTDQSAINVLDANNTTYSNLNVIKAYYDTSAANGELELFKANITGGDITLTGNVVSTGNGKIVLMGGYGKIDVTNNTNYKLVTSKLNADNPVYGKLTIRDFITTPTTDNLDAYYTKIQSEIENSSWYKKKYGDKKIADMSQGELTQLDSYLKGNYTNGDWLYYALNIDGYRGLVTKYLYAYNNNYNTAINGDIAANNNIYDYIEKAYKAIKTTEERTAFDALLDKIAGKYKAYVDAAGALHTEGTDTSAYTMRSDGSSYTLSNTANRVDDASFSPSTTATDANGLRTTSLGFKPGSDSIYGTTSYSLKLPAYHSWFAWLFGIKHVATTAATTIPIAQSSTPLLVPGGTAATNATSPIAIEFQGYTSPSINIASKGDVKIAGNITVSPGDLNIKSTNGNIYEDQTAYYLTGKNINLYSDGNIGSEAVPIQTLLFGGTLTAQGYSVENASNIYINAPIIDKMDGYNGFTNVNLKSNNDVVLSTSEGNIGDITGNVNITGKDVSLKALNGIVNLNKDNSNIVASNSIKAQAEGDITLTTQGDMKVSKIYTTGEGNVNLTALNGNIVALDTTSTFHVNGNNLTISAINGYVGGTNTLLTRNTGTFNVSSKNDIKLDNVATDTYVGLIESTNGDVSLTSFGAISDASTGAVPYNIKANNLFLNSQFGGIENIAINIDGKLDAYAGYLHDAKNGWIIENAMANAKINLISAAEPLDTATEAEVNAYASNLKDLTVGTVLAANNVTLNSEGSIYTNDNSSDNITGNRINLMATNGSVGTSSKSLNINSNDALTVYAKDSVYLKSTNFTNALKINEIKGSKSKFKDVNTGETNGYAPLNNVVITSNSGILNAADDLSTPNIVAKVVNITVNNNSTEAAAIGVGLATKPLNIYTVVDNTVTDNGLTINSNKNVYLTSSDNDLLINNLDVTGNVQIAKVTSSQVTVPTTLATNDYTYTEYITNADGTVTQHKVKDKNSISVDKIVTQYKYDRLDHNLNIKNSTITGNLTAKAKDLTIGTANISNTLNTDSVNLTMTDAKVGGSTNLNVDNLATIAKADFNTLSMTSKDLDVTDTLKVSELASIDLTGSADIKNIISTATDSTIDIELANNLTVDSLTAANNVILKAGQTTTIGSTDIAGTLLSNSKVFKVLDKLTVNNEADIYSTNSIDINNAKITKDLNMESKDINIDEIELLGNMNVKADKMTVNTSNDLKLGLVQGYSEKYNSDFNLTTAKSMLNGNSDPVATNIKSKDIDIMAGVGIGSKTNTINIELPSGGGTLKTVSKDTINIATTNGAATYSKIKTDNLILNSKKDLTINSMDINTGNIITQTPNFSMYDTEIKTLAYIYTQNKFVIVKNTDLLPVVSADIQIYVTQHPIHLVLDGSSNVSTESANVTRQNKNILIDGIKETNSMDAESNTDVLSSVQQNKISNAKGSETFNKQMNGNAKLADYIKSSTETQLSKLDSVDSFLKNVSSITIDDNGSNARPAESNSNANANGDEQADNQNAQTGEMPATLINKPDANAGIKDLSNNITGKGTQEQILRRIIKY